MKISIVTRYGGKPESEFAYKLRHALRDQKHDIELYPLDWSWTSLKVSPLNTSDLVISVGGDGTLLSTVSMMQIQRPILGVNFGGVGFLTDIEQANAIEEICKLTKSNIRDVIDSEIFPIEKRMRIDVFCDGRLVGTALNEIAFKTEYSNMIKFSVCVDDVVITKFKGDGLLISTPTGSTAYALSAGGPLTDTRMSCFLVVPIAPYLLSSRPQVIHGSRKLTVNANDGVLIIDGNKVDHFYPTDCKTLEFRVSDNPALFVDVKRNFFEKVNTKLKTL